MTIPLTAIVVSPRPAPRLIHRPFLTKFSWMALPSAIRSS